MNQLRIWLFASLIVLFACSLLPAAATPVPPTETPASPTAPPTNTTSTVVNSAQIVFAGGTISLDLPSGWGFSDLVRISYPSGQSFEIYLLGETPLGDDGPGISRVAILDPAQWTPEDFALAQCSACPQNPFEDVVVGGQPARRTQVGGGGVPFSITWYFVEHNGKLIAFAIHDPETLLPLEDVIASIRFE
jgi:hypothetical protein